jgi:hypothetical protein
MGETLGEINKKKKKKEEEMLILITQIKECMKE